MNGFELQLLPVTAPGIEQKATWLQMRQSKPDYVFLWGWGVMNSTALKEAQATGYPRDKMYGVWWAGAEPDVKDVGEGAKGYNALALQHRPARSRRSSRTSSSTSRQGPGHGRRRTRSARVLYTRGVIIQMLGVEAVRRAQERFGKGKVMTGEQVRWGLENLALDQKKLDALGFAGVMRPISHLVRRPHGLDLGAHRDLGRQEVEHHAPTACEADDADHQADGEGRGRQVRWRTRRSRDARRRLPDLSATARLAAALLLPPSPEERRAPRGPFEASRAVLRRVHE